MRCETFDNATIKMDSSVDSYASLPELLIRHADDDSEDSDSSRSICQGWNHVANWTMTARLALADDHSDGGNINERKRILGRWGQYRTEVVGGTASIRGH
jgi:hypothetical protein